MKNTSRHQGRNETVVVARLHGQNAQVKTDGTGCDATERKHEPATNISVTETSGAEVIQIEGTEHKHRKDHRQRRTHAEKTTSPAGKLNLPRWNLGFPTRHRHDKAPPADTSKRDRSPLARVWRLTPTRGVCQDVHGKTGCIRLADAHDGRGFAVAWDRPPILRHLAGANPSCRPDGYV